MSLAVEMSRRKNVAHYNKSNSSGDEIANVNFFYDTSSVTFMQCTLEATEFGEIMQNKSHYAVQVIQGH